MDVLRENLDFGVAPGISIVLSELDIKMSLINKFKNILFFSTPKTIFKDIL